MTNISSLQAENQINQTNMSLQTVLQQLSSGSRINNGSDDPAGLAIADGLGANITALTQSGQNATDAVGMSQVADGALSQVTTLLNRAITLATQASTGTEGTGQLTALDNEFTSIKNEIDAIGSSTTYNGTAVFGQGSVGVYLSDGTTTGTQTVSVDFESLGSANLGTTGTSSSPTAVSIAGDNLTTAADAQTALADLNSAVAGIANFQGNLGSSVDQLQAASSVLTTQVQNLTSAQSNITSADVTKDVGLMSQYNVLQQTGMAALQQANQMQQSVVKLLQS